MYNVDTEEATDVILIKKFTAFLPPRPGRKNSHTSSYIFAVTAVTCKMIIAHSDLCPFKPEILGGLSFRKLCKLR